MQTDFMLRRASKKQHFIWAVVLAALLALLTGCAEEYTPSASDAAQDEVYTKMILQSRAKKDMYLKESDKSPIPAKIRNKFKALPYFDVSSAYRIPVALHKNATLDTFTMLTNTGAERQAVRYGQFRFALAGTQQVLHVYKLLDMLPRHGNYLFVPFQDETSGQESYAGGRFLDFQEKPDNAYILDFNMAYNPLCAYGSDDYVCPIPPRENRLSVAVRAGEMLFPLH